ncbi:MAG: hypothetical protein ACLUGF_02085 [Clostridium sp.]
MDTAFQNLQTGAGKVMQAINSMTGLTVKQVNVRIAGVSLEQD